MSTPRQRVILTGARGSIGRAFIAYMAREHPTVEIAPLMPFPFRMSSIVESLKAGATHMVNLASMGSDADCVKSPHTCFDTNVQGVYTQLEAIRLYAPHVRFLNAGTIYENTDSNTPYIASKRAAREVVKTYRETYGLYAVTATLGFTESIHRSHHYLSRKITKGVARIARAIKDDVTFEPLELRDIDQCYGWVWAEDVADGMWKMLMPEFIIRAEDYQRVWAAGTPLAITREEPKDYTLSSNDPHTVREFVETAFSDIGITGVWAKLGEKLGGFAESEVFVADHWHDASNGTGWNELLTLVKTTPGADEKPPVNPLPEDLCRAAYHLSWHPRYSFRDIVTTMVRADMVAVGL